MDLLVLIVDSQFKFTLCFSLWFHRLSCFSWCSHFASPEGVLYLTPVDVTSVPQSLHDGISCSGPVLFPTMVPLQCTFARKQFV